MIHGIGCDIIEIKRVESVFRRYGDTFLRRILNEREIALAGKHHAVAPRLAKYIAAKEAAFKALGVGRTLGLGWHDFEVHYAATGQPLMRLSDKIGLMVGEVRVHLTISDSKEYAMAYVMAEKTCSL